MWNGKVNSNKLRLKTTTHNKIKVISSHWGQYSIAIGEILEYTFLFTTNSLTFFFAQSCNSFKLNSKIRLKSEKIEDM